MKQQVALVALILFVVILGTLSLYGVAHRSRFPLVRGMALSHLTTSPAAHVEEVWLLADRPENRVGSGVRVAALPIEAQLHLIAWNIVWDSRFLPNGRHTLVIRAYSNGKIIAEQSQTVDVENSNEQSQ